MKITKCVIIGSCGHINYALQDIRQYPELTVCGIATADPVDVCSDLNVQITEEFNCRWFDDFRVMLDQLKPDVAIIATRFDLNGPVSLECLKRGINCFTEKSIAHNFEILEELRNTAEQNDALIIGMHGMRYEPEFYAAYQAVKNGLIGKPMLFTGQKSYKFGNDRPDFYRQRSTYGGTILWVAVHAIDWACWIMGEINDISAHHSNAHNFDYGDCEATAVMSFSFANGAMGTINADFYQPQQSKLHGGDQLRIAGNKGIIEVGNKQAFITTHEQPLTELPLEPGEFFADFCRKINNEGKCRLSMQETFRVNEIALQARASADSHSPVNTQVHSFS
ncbi:MAG: Gfo/Idh/MocA family oxidoreductase [Victivallaceae bacterium]|nr:Gfo/Idh/MocA family oxidoreductase [Victivallaceae bacterium]